MGSCPILLSNDIPHHVRTLVALWQDVVAPPSSSNCFATFVAFAHLRYSPTLADAKGVAPRAGVPITATD